MTRGATTIPATIAACLDGFVDSDGLREVVGSRLPRVVGDELKQLGKVAQLELSQLVARAAHRVGAGAANGGRDVVNVDGAFREEEVTDAVLVPQSAPLEERGEVRREFIEGGS